MPSLTFGPSGKSVPYPTYHNTKDAIGLITPEIMEDTAQLFFMAVMDISDEPAGLNFRPEKK